MGFDSRILFVYLPCLMNIYLILKNGKIIYYNTCLAVYINSRIFSDK